MFFAKPGLSCAEAMPPRGRRIHPTRGGRVSNGAKTGRELSNGFDTNTLPSVNRPNVSAAAATRRHESGVLR